MERAQHRKHHIFILDKNNPLISTKQFLFYLYNSLYLYVSQQASDPSFGSGPHRCQMMDSGQFRGFQVMAEVDQLLSRFSQHAIKLYDHIIFFSTTFSLYSLIP